MKPTLICLAFALLCGVSLAYNCEEYRKYYLEALSVRQAMVQTGNHRAAWPGIDQHIASLAAELDLCANRTTIEKKPCTEAQNKAEKNREAVMFSLFRGKSHKNRDESDITYIKTSIANLMKYRLEVADKCNKVDICKQAKSDLQMSQGNLRSWRGVKDYDPLLLASIESEVETYKKQIAATCNASDICAFALGQVNKTQEAITYEMSTGIINRDAIEKLGITYRTHSDQIINTCDAAALCPFIQNEQKITEESLKSVIKSTRADITVIEDFQTYIAKLKKAHSDKCDSHGSSVRLAEFASRFLSKLMKH